MKLLYLRCAGLDVDGLHFPGDDRGGSLPPTRPGGQAFFLAELRDLASFRQRIRLFAGGQVLPSSPVAVRPLTQVLARPGGRMPGMSREARLSRIARAENVA